MRRKTGTEPCPIASLSASAGGDPPSSLALGDIPPHLPAQVRRDVDAVALGVRHWLNADHRAGMSGGRDGLDHLVRDGEGPPLPRAVSQAGSHGDGEARLHDDARSEAIPLHGHGVEVEGRLHRPVLVARSCPDVRRLLVEIQAPADVEALVLHDPRSGVEEPRCSSLG